MGEFSCVCDCSLFDVIFVYCSSLPQGEFPLSPTADSGVTPHNHIGSRTELGDPLASPRKKPRKQNM